MSRTLDEEVMTAANSDLLLDKEGSHSSTYHSRGHLGREAVGTATYVYSWSLYTGICRNIVSTQIPDLGSIPTGLYHGSTFSLGLSRSYYYD